VYKLGFSATIVAVGVACTYAGLKQHPVGLSIVGWVLAWTFLIVGWVLAWTFLLLLAYSCLRLKRVVAHSDHLLISNYITEDSVLYGDIEEIKGYRARSAVFVRLRLRIACRFGRTIHFLLPSTFAAIESQPEFQMLHEKCPQLSEPSRGSQWLETFYLRPRVIPQGGIADERGWEKKK
jgi:hypothetical protein